MHFWAQETHIKHCHQTVLAQATFSYMLHDYDIQYTYSNMVNMQLIKRPALIVHSCHMYAVAMVTGCFYWLLTWYSS